MVHLNSGDYKAASDTLLQLIKAFPRYERLGRVKLHTASLLMVLEQFSAAKDLLVGAIARGGSGSANLQSGFGTLDTTFFLAILCQRWAFSINDPDDQNKAVLAKETRENYKIVLDELIEVGDLKTDLKEVQEVGVAGLCHEAPTFKIMFSKLLFAPH